MKVDRLPCSGETLLGSGYRVDYGGKGSNQAVGCARLGAQASFVGKIGQDTWGEMALRLYHDEGMDTSHIIQTAAAPTGVGFIMVEKASGRNCITIDPGANELLTSAEVFECGAFDCPNVVLTQLEIPGSAAEAALARGRSSGAITILNPAPVRPLPARMLQLIDVLTPNETEARVLAGQSLEAAIPPQETARELLGRGVRKVVMTLGEKGALIVTDSSCTQVSAIRVSSVDTTGAGDAFNAGLAVALASGTSLEAAVRFAVITGGLAVTKEGVIPSLPGRADVLEFYNAHGLTVPVWLAAGSSGPASK
jgi:ribokinase